MGDSNPSDPAPPHTAALIDRARAQFDELQRRRSFDQSSASNGENQVGLNVDRIASFLGDSVSGYEIVREIHRGGQGVVYQATESVSGRTVALKVIRHGSNATESEKIRLQREAHILQHLNHPNIVGMIDSGMNDHHHYFVMDFVDGQPLDVFTSQLQMHDAIELFARICDAVHAAHLRGIIHRDLKPSNILIDRDGEPNILDFGLAKIISTDATFSTEPAAITMTGQFVGSLPWASPEQAMGNGASDDLAIDIRSDVYSLGVMLYQILTGTFPYRVIGATRDVLDNIISAAPTSPRSLNNNLDDEIETIALKCLSKEPARRYQSSGELALDLQRYLADEPIAAKRDSLGYVLRKQLKRHRTAVGIAGAFVLLTVAGALICLTLWRTAVRERNDKESQRARAESINSVLHNMLASANPELSKGREITVAEVLADAAREIDAGSLGDQRDVEASIRFTLGESYLAMGKLEPAEHQLRKSLELNESIHGHNHPATALCLTALGRWEYDNANFAQALALHEQAIAILQAAPQPRYEVPSIMMDKSWALTRLARRDEAQQTQQQALALMTQLRGENDPQTTRLKTDVALFSLTPDKSIPILQQALQQTRESLGPNHPQVVRMLRTLAGEYHKNNQRQEAERTYLEALSLCEQVYGPTHPEILTILQNLEWLFEQSGHLEQGTALMRKYEPVARSTFGRESVRYADYLFLLGLNIEKTEHAPQQKREGEQMVRDALDIYKRLGRDQSWQGAECRVELARMHLERNELQQAEQLANETLAIQGSADLLRHRHAKAKGILGELLMMRGEFTSAEQILLEEYESIKDRKTASGSNTLTIMRLIKLYELWSASDPNARKAEQLEQWKTRLAEIKQAPLGQVQ